MRRTAGRARSFAILIVLAVSASAFALPAGTALGWANGGTGSDGVDGDGYGTHDWVIDQALKVLNGRVSGWFDARTARLASDDPDTIEARNDPAMGNDHVYRGKGYRGGAINRISVEYDLAQAAYQRGDYEDASYHIGLLSHFYSDILQPFHTAYAAIGKDSAHLKYELLVNTGMKTASGRPEWQSSRRTVSTFSNIRTKAIAAAAYSRGYFAELWSNFSKDETRLNARVSQITGYVLKRAENDLADVIWSISQGVGAGPQVGSLKMSVRWTGVLSGSTTGVFVTLKDVNGKPIEGLRVTIKWPTPTGTRDEKIYTDGTGWQQRWRGVGTTPKLVLRDIVASVTVRGVTTSAHAQWAITPRLPSGNAGFKTVVNDSSVVPGQTVKVTTIARNSSGHGVPNLLITWVWDFNGHKVRTHGITDANGRASSTRLITTATTKTRVYVTAKTQSGSANRSSQASFKRVS
jgi:hypothetical protein